MEPSGNGTIRDSIYSKFYLHISVVLYQSISTASPRTSQRSLHSVGHCPGSLTPIFMDRSWQIQKHLALKGLSQNRLPPKVDVLSSFFIIFPVTMGQSGATSDTAKLVKKRMCCPHFRAAGLFKTWQWRSATHEAIDLH